VGGDQMLWADADAAKRFLWESDDLVLEPVASAR
jgi:hypothetical protein